MEAKKPLGVLIIHGFTAGPDAMRGLVPTVERLGLPWRLPTLRGHGTRPEDLVGVTAAQWREDAEAALADLLGEVDQAVIVGLSMGGLVTLNMAIGREKDLAGLVLLAPAIRFADPLVGLTGLIKLFVPFWPSPNSFADAECAKACTNYPRFPTATFASLLEYAGETERKLEQVRVPALILHSRKDTVIHPQTVRVLEERLGSPEKRVVWYERSGHEMLMDCEAEAIFATIGDYLAERAGRAQAAS